MHRSPLRSALSMVCVAVLALPLAGCGGDDEDSGGDRSAPTVSGTPVSAEVADYIADVEPICKAAQADLADITSAFEDDQSAQGFRTALGQSSERLLEQIAEIEAVTPPAEIAQSVDDWLAAFTTAAEKLSTVTLAQAEKGNLDLFGQSDPIAEAIGLGSCTASAG